MVLAPSLVQLKGAQCPLKHVWCMAAGQYLNKIGIKEEEEEMHLVGSRTRLLRSESAMAGGSSGSWHVSDKRARPWSCTGLL